MFCYMVYSHSTYSDCWIPHFGRLDRYCPFEFEAYMLLTDSFTVSTNCFFNIKNPVVAFYQEDKAYCERVLLALENSVEQDFIFFCHEDMILYDIPNTDYFSECVNTIVEDDAVDFIKLLKSGCSGNSYKGSKILQETSNSSKYNFSIQPTLWKKDRLIKFLKNNPGRSACELEEYCQSHFEDSTQLFSYDITVDKQRGSMHTDSTTWPAMSTAIRKGRWITSEYGKELENLFEEYGIDSSERGVI